MKQRLNFSPKPFVTRDGSVVLLWLLNLLLLAGLGLTLFYWAGLRGNNQTAHQQIDQLQTRQRELADQHQDRIHELETIDVRAYREQVRQFHRIQTAYQTNWGALLDDLGLILPADVRIVSLAPSTQVNRTQEQRTEETIINLKGEARNKIAQLEFIRALQQNPVFEDVRFENEEYNKAGVAIAFEIRFSHKPGKRGQLMRNYLYGTLPQSLTALALFLLVGALWIFGVKDEKSIQLDSSVRLDSEELAITSIQAQASKTGGIVADYQHNLDEINNFRNTFLKRKDERVVRISEFLAERAQTRGIKMERVEYESSKTREDKLDLYVTNLPLTGRYRDIRAFIHDIEESDMFLIITELSLEDDNNGAGAVRMQLSLATYFEGATMSEQKRLLLLLGTVAVLIAANFFVYLGEDKFDSTLFGDELKTGYAPQVAGLIHDLENLPRLDFQAGRSMGDLEVTAQRNPFIFGIDRAREVEREQRMQELRQSREVVAQVIQAEPEVEKARFDGQIIGLMGNSQNQDNYMVSVSFEQEIHILKVGDQLKNRYRLTGANQELVTFLHLASGEEVRIKLETK